MEGNSKGSSKINRKLQNFKRLFNHSPFLSPWRNYLFHLRLPAHPPSAVTQHPRWRWIPPPRERFRCTISYYRMVRKKH